MGTVMSAEEAFARLLSHDLRAPLGPLVLAVSSLADDSSLDEGARELARMAAAQCDRLNRTMQACLWALRGPDVRREPVDLGAAAAAAIGSLGRLSISCELDRGADVSAWGDEQRVTDALCCVIEVASGRRARAKVRVVKDGMRALVCVQGEDYVVEPPQGAPADGTAAALNGARALFAACGGGLTFGSEVIAWLPCV